MMKRWKAEAIDVEGNVVKVERFWTAGGAARHVDRLSPPVPCFGEVRPLWTWLLSKDAA